LELAQLDLQATNLTASINAAISASTNPAMANVLPFLVSQLAAVTARKTKLLREVKIAAMSKADVIAALEDLNADVDGATEVLRERLCAAQVEGAGGAAA